MSFSSKAFYSSPDIPVHFAGLESSTWRLQQNGWRIGVEERPNIDQVAIVMKNTSLKLVAFGDRYSWESLRFSPERCILGLQVIGRNVSIQHMGQLPSFTEIDARPERLDYKTSNLYDLPIFRKKLGDEVIYQQADMTIVEHLEEIRKLQAPKQDELRSRAIELQKREQRQDNVVSLIGI